MYTYPLTDHSSHHTANMISDLEQVTDTLGIQQLILNIGVDTTRDMHEGYTVYFLLVLSSE